MKAILICLFIWLSIGLQAQPTAHAGENGKITGKIVDSVTKTPLEYATITVMDKSSGKILTGGASNDAGLFTIASVPAGDYTIIVESIGYRKMTLLLVPVQKGKTVDLKLIRLIKKDQDLSAVTVTAKARLVENKIDKLIFNAEKDLTTAGGVATDLLKKVPQVSVDVDGNVQLAGNGSIRFLINGKPSTAFGSNVADVLQSIPASQIKSIEVITNPGARYDAQGMGGIINIILKTNTAKGINGNVSLTAGTRVENGAVNFNARNKNIGLNAFVSGNTRLPVSTPYTSERNSTDTVGKTNTLLLQNGNTRLKRYGLQSGMGLDWTYKKHNSFSASVNYDIFGTSTNGLIDQVQQNSNYNGSLLNNLVTLNNTDSRNRSHNVDLSFNYKRTFAREDQELEFAVNSSIGRTRGNAANEQFLMPQDSLYYGVMNNNPGKENETQVTLDYTQPLSEKIQLGTGVKTTFFDISSEAAAWGYSPLNKDYLYAAGLSNNLQYHQQVYAGYAELSFPVGKLFDVKAGGRYERTEINSYYSNAQQQVKKPGYNTWVPSLFLSKKIEEGQVIKLSYSKRIERPDYEDLNPFVNTSDPKNITAGNPYLLPELGQRVELSYSRDIGNIGSVILTGFYRHNQQDIQPYVKYYPSLIVGDSTYYNVSVSTRENIGTENNTGLNIFSDLHPTAKLGLRTNLSFFHRKIINAIDVGQSRTSFNYRMNLNVSYQFSPLLAGEFFGNFNSARNEVQGRYPSLTTYSIAMRKMIWHKKGSVALTATNPFNEYVKQQLDINGPGFTTTTIRKIPFRSIGINFTWKFGKLEFKNEHKEEGSDMNNL
ncbi:TonB-dependent receptor [Niastella yeongjuensis]|uniref:TonB-dependent receptor n=1 Tax=Niastella yeongjuensis TaxID=354355 RepID=A0A1V9EA46_9BACT|nr:TonB-dependent receptor [Niastella yeongjuensis]OQP42961.1 TonB-dependent receptor [Niastella yeongjuensis]SEO61064.1 Outer membrane receptor proteins, mostly Fe transport [Niastella yeongjuensis]